MTWPTGKTILFGVPRARNSGRFDPKFPYGDTPVGNASGSGLVDSSGAPIGYATGGASGAGLVDIAGAPQGNASGGGLTLLLSALDHTQSADQTNIGVSNGGQTTWMTDGSGRGYFARIAFNGAGSFLGLNWNFPANISEVYIVFNRRSSSATLGSKRLKLFGQGYPTIYSNITFHSANSYSGTDQVTGWSDSPGGGDISCETTDAGFPYPGSGATLPNMGLGSAFDDASWHYSTGVTPYPVQHVTSTVVNDTNWHTEGFYVKRNSNGNHDGAMGKIRDGVVTSAFTGMINCGTNLQNFSAAGFGNYSQSTFNEDYTDIFIYAGKPSWFIW